MLTLFCIFINVLACATIVAILISESPNQINPDLFKQTLASELDLPPNRAPEGIWRISFQKNISARKCAGRIHRPRFGRQPLPAVSQWRARGFRTGQRRSEPLAFRDYRHRASLEIRQKHAGRGRLEFRRVGRLGPIYA